MTHDETRDNTTAIEAVMMAADSAEDILVALGHSPEAAEQMANPSEPDDDNRSPELRVARAWWKTLRARIDAAKD